MRYLLAFFALIFIVISAECPEKPPKPPTGPTPASPPTPPSGLSRDEIRAQYRDAIRQAINTRDSAQVQQAVGLATGLTYADWEEIKGWQNEVVANFGAPVGNFELVLDKTHLSAAKVRDPLSEMTDVAMNDDQIKTKTLALFDKLEFSDATEAGKVGPTDRFEDDWVYHPTLGACSVPCANPHDLKYRRRNKDKSFTDLCFNYGAKCGGFLFKNSLRDYLTTFLDNAVSPVFRPAHKAEELKKLRLTIDRLESGKLDKVVVNRVVIDMALAGTHCASRFAGQIDKGLDDVTDGGANLAETFEQEVMRSFLNWREDLVNEHFNKAPPNEVGHGKHYWLQLIGKYIGLPNHPPDPAMQPSWISEKFLGPNYNLSAETAVNEFYSVLYTLPAVQNHFRNSVMLPSTPERYRIQTIKFNDWLDKQGIAKSDVYTDDYKNLTDKGVQIVLMQLDAYLTYRFKP